MLIMKWVTYPAVDKPPACFDFRPFENSNKHYLSTQHPLSLNFRKFKEEK
ncbi:hypothetical protein PEPS_26340 [Persicobacter psychrovividus]|uniref:Uncharacterized protein n=1 Tax=Persicobacter psychrovividus TaxID=387638 RepID=A0ABN6LC01_9BACT|nr:hypothetical protein PEPS_26340 [Persicobacter psychrovividus]